MTIEAYKREEQKLFDDWKKSPLHQGKPFITDGIVNPESWFSEENKDRPKILFVFKEAYNGPFSLNEWLSKENPKSAMWNRVAEWIYGINNTYPDRIARYKEMVWTDIQQISYCTAVVNLKKSNGKSNSDIDEILCYAQTDAELLKRQFDLIAPDVIVCGYTFGALKTALDLQIDKEKKHNDNWYYWDRQRRLYIDYYHPANQYPALINYYGLICIYQQALIEKAMKQ